MSRKKPQFTTSNYVFKEIEEGARGEEKRQKNEGIRKQMRERQIERKGYGSTCLPSGQVQLTPCRASAHMAPGPHTGEIVSHLATQEKEKKYKRSG